MHSDVASCSDCKIELIERKWTRVLLSWLNNCIKPSKKAMHLNLVNLVDIVNKYRDDICSDDLNRALLCTDDLEPFLRYKYPILRLRNLMEPKELKKKVYIMTSVLLFHCCVNSQCGQVEKEICEHLSANSQEIILKFCEALSEMEVTINNVERAIEVATKIRIRKEKDLQQPKSISDEALNQPSAGNLDQSNKSPILTFKSSITVLPSVVTDTSISPASFEGYSDLSDFKVSYAKPEKDNEVSSSDSQDDKTAKSFQRDTYEGYCQQRPRCLQDVLPDPCRAGICCGDPGRSVPNTDSQNDTEKRRFLKNNWKIFVIAACSFVLLILIIVLSTIPLWKKQENETAPDDKYNSIVRFGFNSSFQLPDWLWQCKDGLCQRILHPSSSKNMFSSMSRCILICTGPQLWPLPIGYTYYSKTIISLSTSKLEYKFQSIPTDAVHQYLAEAFKLFLKDLARLEKIDTKSWNKTKDDNIKKMIIQIDVESDADPRLRLNTEEAYMVKIDTIGNQAWIKINAVSFCGIRHGLETLSQMILLDQSTGNLITVSNAVVKDAPTYKYRGLMIDTGSNFIPVVDLMKTIDAMASCKLNTLHWRITSDASFPLKVLDIPELNEHGPYDRDMVYTKEDIRFLVKRAGVRGIRVLIEVALPGPVGRPWSWMPEATCSKKNNNFTCDNVLCLRLPMHTSVFDLIQLIYTEIIEMTNLDDIFHLSDGIFSLSNCFGLIDDRDGFLEKALYRLKIANKGFLPKLPIIWYTPHLTRDFEMRTWDRLGVQVMNWDPKSSEQHLSKYKVIHSSKWDLSCEMKRKRCTKYRTWQEMYSWKSWRNVEVFSIEGGEAVLWTDLVDSGNLDEHLWPRAAAVAERLWSDVVTGYSGANRSVYVRLDSHRWRMLLRGVDVQPIWPAWCSFNPGVCLEKLRQ